MKPNLYCIVGKTASWKDTIWNIISNKLNLKSVAVSDVLKQYCIQHNIIPTRESLSLLWNTVFDWKKCAQELYQLLWWSWVITGIRKPETLNALRKYFDKILIIWCICDDKKRYDRSQQRNKIGDICSFEEFITQEKWYNSYPSRENINIILWQSDYIINNTLWLKQLKEQINHIITLEYKQFDTPRHTDQQWRTHYIRWKITNQKWKILAFDDPAKGWRIMPGGKVDRGEWSEQALIRELHEELWVVIDRRRYQWHKLWIKHDGPTVGHYFDVTIWNQIPQNIEQRYTMSRVDEAEIKV
jgi:dephospho-CoA kinase